MPRYFAKISLGSVFCATGVAFLVYILVGISLQITLLGALLGFSILGIWIWRSANQVQRAAIFTHFKIGLLASFAATGAYDLSRYILVKTLPYSISPFRAWLYFGQALLGRQREDELVWALGFLYHLANGIGFGIAYVFWWGGKGIWAGILWALTLETIMLSLYPRWFAIPQFGEFVQVSLFGHLIYGLVLGFLSRKCLSRIKF